MTEFEGRDRDVQNVVVADAFATAPHGGVPIAVLPDGSSLTAAQLLSVASELGAVGAVSVDDEDSLRYVSRQSSAGIVDAAIAGGWVGFERSSTEPGTCTIHTTDAGTPNTSDTQTEQETTTHSVDFEILEQGTVTLDMPCLSVEDVDRTLNDVMEKLGMVIEPSTYSELSLPVGRVSGFGGKSLVVPIPHLQDVTDVEDDGVAIGGLLETSDTDRLVLLTFDTLEGINDVHARVFEQAGTASERPVSGIGTAAIGAYLSHHEAYGGDRTAISIESGRILDRPALSTTSLDAEPRITGRAITVLDGKMLVPAAEDDDIIVA